MSIEYIMGLEEKIVSRHRKRAERLGLTATLTLSQWMDTLRYFEGMCAYCQAKPYEVLEHFIPLGLGGGTTAQNCVPACRSCNISKGEWHPLHLPFYYCPGTQRVMEGVGRVQRYLAGCESGVGV